MFENLRLDEERGFGGVKSDGEPIGGDLQSVFRYGRGIFIMGREGVPIGDEEKTFIFFLQLQPVRERAKEMTDVKTAGWAHAAENSFELSQPGELLPRGRLRWRGRCAIDRARLRSAAFRSCLRKSLARGRRDNSARHRFRANSRHCHALAPRGRRRDWPFRWRRASHERRANRGGESQVHAIPCPA